MKIDYSLYLVTDRSVMSSIAIEEGVEQAILGGCTMVQLREKKTESLDFYRIAVKVKNITEKYDIPLIINDRIDIALAVQAKGVHLGQKDIPAKAAREIIGKDMLLGISVTSVEEAQKAVASGADYLGVGAMFSTKTKADAKQVSIEKLQEIRKKIKIPIVVIGGIGKDNAGRFPAMGVDGIAVVSAILARPDIRGAAAELKAVFSGKTE